jgi:cytochrome c
VLVVICRFRSFEGDLSSHFVVQIVAQRGEPVQDAVDKSESKMRFLIALLPVAAVCAFTALPAAGANGAPDPGAQAFATCRACHTLEAGGASTIGPNLHGLFGRRAGAVAGANYSPALKASNIVWDAQTLDEFLAAPTQKVPGTLMAMKVADPARRAALIAYLKAETSK